MSMRKLLLVCVFVAVAILPLVGCNGGGSDGGATGGSSDTSNTTTAE